MTDSRAAKAKAIYLEAIECADEDRGGLLDQRCAGDAQLRAEVDAYLAAEAEAGEFLSGGPQGIPVADSGTSRGNVPFGDFAGTVVGRYKLLQLIGEGGFGAVYMAEQSEAVRRRVALKIIKLGMDTREVVARFEAERQALAMMDHPNIARVLDAGATDSGRPYFVMELVNGIPITAYCDTNKLSARQRLELMIPVCRAVQSAHQKGIIHRDLKPSNVMVTLHDGRPVPKVIDFGIAKATGTQLTDRTLFTAYHQFVGTPAYMSPEQAEMSGLDIDTRTDIYALGVMLYELLTGTTPVDPAAIKAAGPAEMVRLICDTEPVRPSTRLSTLGGTLTAVASARSIDGRKLGQLLRGELDWIVMKALEKDRTRRYDTAAAMADDLCRYLAAEAVEAGPPGGVYRLRKLARRYRTAIGVAALLGFALLLGVAGTTIGLVRERQQRRIADARSAEAVAGRAEAERQRKNAQDIVAFLVGDVLTQASPEKVPDKTVRDALVKTLIEPALKDIDNKFKDQPLVQATIRQTLAQTLRTLGYCDRALPQAEAALAKRKELLGDDDADTLESLQEVAHELALLGRLNEAEPMYLQRWNQYRRLRGDDNDNTLMAMNDYGYVLQLMGEYQRAVPLAEQAWKSDQRKLGAGHPDTITAMANYAAVLHNVGRDGDAEPLARQAWETSVRVSGDDSPATMIDLLNYGAILQSLGRYAQALPLLKQAWEAHRRVLGEDHPDALLALNDHAGVLRLLGRRTDAEPLYRQALDISRRVLGSDHPQTILAIGNYGTVLHELGRDREAEPLLGEARESAIRILGDDHPTTIAMQGNYAAVLQSLGRNADAEPLVRQVLERDRRVLGDDHPDTIVAIDNYAYALRSLNRLSDAEPLFREAWDRAQRVLGKDHPDTIRALRSYGSVLCARGRYADAEPLLRDALERDRRVLGDDHPDTAIAMKDQANVLIALGRGSDALPLLRKVWDRNRRLLGNDRPETIASLNSYNAALASLNRGAATAPSTRGAQ